MSKANVIIANRWWRWGLALVCLEMVSHKKCKLLAGPFPPFNEESLRYLWDDLTFFHCAHSHYLKKYEKTPSACLLSYVAVERTSTAYHQGFLACTTPRSSDHVAAKIILFCRHCHRKSPKVASECWWSSNYRKWWWRIFLQLGNHRHENRLASICTAFDRHQTLPDWGVYLLTSGFFSEQRGCMCAHGCMCEWVFFFWDGKSMGFDTHQLWEFGKALSVLLWWILPTDWTAADGGCWVICAMCLEL